LFGLGGAPGYPLMQNNEKPAEVGGFSGIGRSDVVGFKSPVNRNA
jgi:hypothetical protein